MAFPIVPYSAVIIDSCASDLAFAVRQASRPHCQSARKAHISRLKKLWTSESNPHHILPCLCVRAAFDLFLRIKTFPEGSEVIMSAVNIPDMPFIVRHHKLKIVPVDINLDTLEPKVALMEKLITSKTVAIVVAHLYGRLIDMDPFAALAQKYQLLLIEDCAEGFCGFYRTGHPQSDLTLFSFGVIKFCTSFGGGIAKVKDYDNYNKMRDLHSEYPVQSGAMYLKKLMKYSVLYSMVQVWPFPHMLQISRQLGKDWKDTFVKFIRGFPDNLIANIRTQPSTALLAVMAWRHQSFNTSDFDLQRIKSDYFLSKLDSELTVVGTKVKVNNYWLFPIIAEDPDLFVKCLGVFGIDSYRGATQLNIVEPDDPDSDLGPNLMSGQFVTASERYPHNAKHLISHVVYLPVNKFVPFHVVDHMAQVCRLVANTLETSKDKALSRCRSLAQSKL
ncbi:uncharacterized protein LOC101848337 [Aplysia californica]|uniref:Uncharacterized protein LOC101848337 n=1 Tax=Aplysia californica TaxID=6500 RepID=A0ABM0JGI9_APLCA|nr:uncharacterized protein LOC101848337 [Aplysia californica]